MHNTVCYISHGGGPLPLFDDAAHRELVAVLQQLAGRIGRPSAILIISAHWEAGQPTVTAAAQPPLLYDYYGFPDQAYQVRYPAPGSPALAETVCKCLQTAGFTPARDGQRGLDHGVFVPLTLMYPAADIPCVQLSLLGDLDPARHIALGRALAALPPANTLILGSGFSFHNMRAFMAAASPDTQAQNRAFEAWLVDTCSNPALDEASRAQQLADWAQAPGARFCHPREEHLLPLHVCYGAAGGAAREVFRFRVYGVETSAYLW